MKPKKCKDCKQVFEPFKIAQPRCVQCAISKGRDYAAKRLKKEENELRKKARADLLQRKEKIKPLSKWAAEAQVIFNRFIRLRDAGRGCISCGNMQANEYHAGHFFTTKARPDLRFNEDNTNLQCGQCNFFESGNISKYRVKIVDRIGQKRLDDLDIRIEIPVSVDYYKSIKEKYKAKIKELELKL